jgi:hypothetical protein
MTQAGDRPLPPLRVSVAGESALWVDPAEIPAADDVAGSVRVSALARAVLSEQKAPALQRGGRIRMTDIDPQADIELHPADEHVTVRVPLAGPVTGEWLRYYQQLALAAKVPVQAQAHDERAWIVVSVPASSDQGEVVATMDAARALIAEADAAARPPATTKAEASVRDWWAARQASAPGRPVSGTRAAGAGAETRWPMAVTLVLAMAVPLLLPARFSLGQP